MTGRCLIWSAALVAGLSCSLNLYAQDPGQAPPAPDTDEPRGIEVQARGPVHEAFATPTGEPAPTTPVSKKPPQQLEEMPPDAKPEGDVLWIGGYWAWDDDRTDFLWVSGIWRTPPPGKQWVAGYWRENGEQWQWVSGFWTAAAPQTEQAEQSEQQVTYLPQPPAPPQTAAPGPAPTEDSFYVPGAWVYNNGDYAWRAGYYARVQPGYVWVSAHYRWTPAGYIYIAGYWDLAMPHRGVLYAPVVVDYAVVGPGYVYTPNYVVTDTVVLDAMFVRPCYCHYYFGDYYGPRYHEWGYVNCYVYSRDHYDAIIVYERYDHRHEPDWFTVRIDLCVGRDGGRYRCPPRTLREERRLAVLEHREMALRPHRELAAAKGIRTVRLDEATRHEAMHQARNMHEVAAQRSHAEVPARPGVTGPHAATLSVPRTQAVTPGMKAAPPPKVTAQPAHPVTPAAATQTTHPAAPAGTTQTTHPAAPAGTAGTTHPPGSPPPGSTPPGSTGQPGTHPPGTTPPGTNPAAKPPPPKPQPKPQPKPNNQSDKKKTNG